MAAFFVRELWVPAFAGTTTHAAKRCVGGL
jgi:hypothetical protein